jgi:hypothetical protein
MAGKKVVVQEVKAFKCCGALRTPENTTTAGKCRACRDARAAQWRKDNQERAREIARKADAKRYASGAVPEYRAKHRDELREYARQWYKNLPEDKLEAVKESKRQQANRYYHQNRDAILAKAALKRAEEKAALHNASL